MAGNFYVLEGSETRICNDYLSEFSKNFLKPHDTRDALPTELPTIREDQFQDLSLETFFDEFRTDIDNLKRSLSTNAPQNLSFNKRINRLEDLKRENPAHPFLEKIDELISFFEKFKIYHTDLNQIIIKDLDREPFIYSPGTVHIQSNVDNIAKIVDDQRALHYIQGGLTARTFPEAFINSMPVNIMAEDEQIGESFNEKIHKCFFSYVNNKGQLSGLSIYYCTAIPDKPFWIISQIDNAHAPSPEKNWKLFFSESLVKETQKKYFGPSINQCFKEKFSENLSHDTTKAQILAKLDLPLQIQTLITPIFSSKDPTTEISRVKKILDFIKSHPTETIDIDYQQMNRELEAILQKYNAIFKDLKDKKPLEEILEKLNEIHQHCSASFFKRNKVLLAFLFLSACAIAAVVIYFTLPGIIVAAAASFLFFLALLVKEVKFRNELPEKHLEFTEAITTFKELASQTPSSALVPADADRTPSLRLP